MTDQNRKPGELSYRGLTDATAVVDEKRRVVRVSFSSELPYKRESIWESPWIEVLGHGENEVDLSRLNDGAAVLYNHQRTRKDRIGKVEKAWIEGGRGIADIRLSKRDDISDIWDDLVDGLIANISVSYRIVERTLTKKGENGVDEYRVTNWVPMEISVVDIPADHTVGIGRAFSVPYLCAFDGNRTDLSEPNLSPGARAMTTKTDSRENFRREEQQRRNEILEMFRMQSETAEIIELRNACLNDMDITVDAARKLLLDEIGRNKAPAAYGFNQSSVSVSNGGRYGRVSINQSRSQELNANFTEVLLHRRGLATSELTDDVRSMMHMTFRDVVRANLDMSGSYYPGMTPSDEFARFHTSSDLTQLLANVASKSMLSGFDNPELATHRDWTTEVPVKDFKPHKAVALSELEGGLQLVREGGELTYTTLSDSGVDIEIARYERGIIFSREMYINDDLSALDSIPLKFGQAALRLEKDIVFGQIVANPTMGDGNALFHSSHGNVGTSAALSVASLGEAKKLMRLQRNLKGEEYLDVSPAYLLVPAALETTAEQVINSIFDPDGSNSSTANPFSRKLKIVVEPRLDADSSTAWYLVCSPNTFQWFSRAYLEGLQAPQIEGPVEDFDTSALKFKCRHEFTGAAIRWEGAVKNAGS